MCAAEFAEADAATESHSPRGARGVVPDGIIDRPCGFWCSLSTLAEIRSKCPVGGRVGLGSPPPPRLVLGRNPAANSSKVNRVGPTTTCSNGPFHLELWPANSSIEIRLSQSVLRETRRFIFDEILVGTAVHLKRRRTRETSERHAYFVSIALFSAGSECPATRTAKLLPPLGGWHAVTLITCTPNCPSGVVFEGYRNAWRTSETVLGIRVLRVWTYLSPKWFLKRSRTMKYLVSATFARCPSSAAAWT